MVLAMIMARHSRDRNCFLACKHSTICRPSCQKSHRLHLPFPLSLAMRPLLAFQLPIHLFNLQPLPIHPLQNVQIHNCQIHHSPYQLLRRGRKRLQRLCGWSHNVDIAKYTAVTAEPMVVIAPVEEICRRVFGMGDADVGPVGVDESCIVLLYIGVSG